MDLLNYNKFFNIENFSHKKVFDENLLVWNILNNIEIYFKNLKSLKNNLNLIPTHCHIENSKHIYIGENTTIESYSYIKGPCIIGRNSQIRHGAYIRGNVITGQNCIIGHSTEVKNSILLNNVKASHFAYIGDSIVGNNVNIGAGVKLANFRLDKKNISFYLNGERIKTSLNKFGSIIADNCQIGCNSVLNPATFLEKNIICYANVNLGGYFEENSIIKSSNKILIKKRNIK